MKILTFDHENCRKHKLLALCVVRTKLSTKELGSCSMLSVKSYGSKSAMICPSYYLIYLPIDHSESALTNSYVPQYIL